MFKRFQKTTEPSSVADYREASAKLKNIYALIGENNFSEKTVDELFGVCADLAVEMAALEIDLRANDIDPLIYR